MATNSSLKEGLQKQQTELQNKGNTPKTIQQWVKTYEKQIAKALPSVITPERFSRMVLTAITKTPKLAECSPGSFIGAMLVAAQLGLEPNTPLGQAYLIPYKRECQFQIGYKGLIDLAYRSGQIKCIMAEIVYENDEFSFEYGLNPELKHKPAMSDRGEAKWVYAVYKLNDGGYSFKVMSMDDVIAHGQKYSNAFNNGPWQTATEEMAKKTVLKQLLKYAPLKSEFVRGTAYDENTVSIDTQTDGESIVIPTNDFEVSERSADYNVDEETGELKDFAGTPFAEARE